MKRAAAFLFLVTTVTAQEGANEALLGIVAVQREGATVISAVLPKSPADKAKLKKGDELVSIADKAIKSPEDVNRALAAAKPKSKVKVVFRREERDSTVEAKLVARADYDQDFLKRRRRGDTGYKASAWHAYAWGNLKEGQKAPALEDCKGKVVVFHAFQSW
jgi:predicted metalloprotease with PDZ domain